jgi:hypothetical protein
MIAEPENSVLPVSKPTIGNDSEPVYSTFQLHSLLPKVPF